MVRAILDGRKTQLRVPVKPQQAVSVYPNGDVLIDGWVPALRSPIGTVGDRLWVRESMYYSTEHDNHYYSADHQGVGNLIHSKLKHKSTPSIHMPRWASRIDLEITRVWVERVQDITEEDAKAEGIVESEIGRLASRVLKNYKMQTRAPVVLQFADLWQSIYGTWDANPFVLAYEFRRIKP